MAGEVGAAGAGGASCAAADAQALAGIWTTTCNGYTCKMNVAASGALATGCSNGQYAQGTLADDGTFMTLGEGGTYPAFSTAGSLTAGSLTAVGCGSLAYAIKRRPIRAPSTLHQCSYVRKVE